MSDGFPAAHLGSVPNRALRRTAQDRRKRRIGPRARRAAETWRHLRLSQRRGMCGRNRTYRRANDQLRPRRLDTRYNRWRWFLRQCFDDDRLGLRRLLRRLCVGGILIGGNLGGEPDRFFQLFAWARFRQITEHLAFVDRRFDRLQVGIARQQNAHRVRRQRLHRFQHLDTRHTGHTLVGDDDVYRMIA